jgi:hypothetical protein
MYNMYTWYVINTLLNIYMAALGIHDEANSSILVYR